MTPGEIETAARRRYNAIGDTFWSQAEIFDYIYGACLEISDEAYAIERTYSTSTVIGTQEYTFPTNAVALKRVTYEGHKLTKIEMIDDDAITGMNQATTDTGTPEFYWIWDDTISLRPIPNAVGTLKIWTLNEPSSIATSTQEVEIPTQHHMRLINYVLSAMAAKDTNFTAASYYLNLWEKDKLQIRKSMARMKRADKFATVKDEHMIVETYIGGS